MDRCRCKEYHKAVEKLTFYTVGTFRPDIVKNYDRSGYKVRWIKNGISHNDFRFEKPKGSKVYQPQELPQNMVSEDSWAIQQMWCPYMTPYVARGGDEGGD